MFLPLDADHIPSDQDFFSCIKYEISNDRAS